MWRAAYRGFSALGLKMRRSLHCKPQTRGFSQARLARGSFKINGSKELRLLKQVFILYIYIYIHIHLHTHINLLLCFFSCQLPLLCFLLCCFSRYFSSQLISPTFLFVSSSLLHVLSSYGGCNGDNRNVQRVFLGINAVFWRKSRTTVLFSISTNQGHLV